GVMQPIWILAATRFFYVPPLTDSLFAVEADEPVSKLWFLSALSHRARHLQERTRRRAAIVRADEAKLLEEFGVVVARQNNHVARLARQFRRHVNHLPVADRSLRRELIERHIQAVGFQLADDVIARFRQLRRTSRARADFDLLAHVLESTVTINRQSRWRGRRRG